MCGSVTCQEKLAYEPVRLTFVALLAVVARGVLTITSEYSTGAIRTTLSVVPSRHRMLGAKAAVFAAVTLAVAAALSSGRAARNRRNSRLHHGDRAARPGAPCRHPAHGRSGAAVQRYYPTNAGQQITLVRGGTDGALGPWTGFAVYCLYVACTFAVALTVLHRRDG